ncbi:MAG: YihY/virulence factor BrkB family protein [Desulfobulbaceae bacterium]|nr:YihY/virulence factor BrkB family protein [Desulfobulbaceae bacterium]
MQAPWLWLDPVFSRFSAWVWCETPAEGPVREFLRTCYRVAFIVAREFRRDKIPLRASALTFTIVLSLVPLLALGTSVLKGLGAGGQMRQAAHVLISQMGATAVVDVSQTSKSYTEGSETTSEQLRQWSPTSLSGHLHQVADTVFDYVEKTKFATMGLVGILVLLFTVYSLLGSIERTFNAIWQTDGNRALGRKLVDYLALLVLLPLTVNFGVAAMVALKSPRLLAHIQQWLPWLDLRVLNLMPVLVMVGTFSLLYGFLPNTRVSKSAAVAGGVVGGLVWLLLQAVYFKLQIVVVRYNAIYGSFAALPLFLLWIYLSWLVFLLGAEVSFGTQIRRRYHWRQLILSPIGKIALAFEILTAAAEDYRHKRLTTRDSLVVALKQPDKHIEELLDILCQAGQVRYVEDGGYLPAAPLVELSAVEICQLFLGELPQTIPADNPACLAMAAMRACLIETRLVGRDSSDVSHEELQCPEVRRY